MSNDQQDRRAQLRAIRAARDKQLQAQNRRPRQQQQKQVVEKIDTELHIDEDYSSVTLNPNLPIYDFLYPFDFDRNLITRAIKRLKCSINSIHKQNVRIIVCNTSVIDIASLLPKMDNLVYVHVPNTKPFNKPKTINYAVKNLVKSDYFFLSDIDLSYPPNYIEQTTTYMGSYGKCKHCGEEQPVRVIPLCKFVQKEHYADYQKLSILPLGAAGLAHGNGLIHTQSLMDIKGYNESMFGYGPEDDECNRRLAWNGNILIHATDIETLHIWHPRGQEDGSTHNRDKFKENQQIFYDVIKKKDIIVNGSNWGEI